MTPSAQSATIGLAVLSWKAPETLIRTLQSYEDSGLTALVDRRLLYVNDIDPARDAAIAERFGYEIAGAANSGITGGMIAMAEALAGVDQLLLMQNDLPAVTAPERTAQEFTFARRALSDGKAQMANLRHRWLPGQGFGRVGKYLGYWPMRDRDQQFDKREHSNIAGVARNDTLAKKLRRALRASKARQLSGGAYYLSSNPEAIHGADITKIDGGYIIDSAAMTYSDQSLLIGREFYLGTLVPYIRANKSRRTINGFPDAEAIINHRPWWGQQHFKIALGDSGIFSHDRRDGFQKA